MESKRKRLLVEIVRTRAELLAQTNKMWLKTYKIFNDDLATITFKPRKIYWQKPTIVEATNSDLSKRHMYWFHYKYMKPNFRNLVLYSDTDSLIYEIESDDLYENLKNNQAITKTMIFQIMLKAIHGATNTKSKKHSSSKTKWAARQYTTLLF